MKILIYEWPNYMTEALHNICDEQHIQTTSFTWKFEQDEFDETFLHYFRKNVQAGYFDFVISVNYWPMLAIACKEKGYKYIAWCCDCPLNITNPAETMVFPTNYVFMFDHNQYLENKNLGIETVYHLPLGANSTKCRSFRYSDTVGEKYASDISFVGTLYESQFPIITAPLDDDTTRLLQEIITNQEELYNYNLIKECMNDELLAHMNRQYDESTNNPGELSNINAKALHFALSCEVTRLNRIKLLNLFGKRFHTNFYSYQTFPLLGGVNSCGKVNYLTEMPYVFRYSKINLNPTLRCIETGVPLRAFDIMGFGGFLLSNYQQELADLYEDGVDMVLYGDYIEAVEKADFYLKNDSLRDKIASNGCRKTLENYTLQKAFEKILDTINR